VHAQVEAREGGLWIGDRQSRHGTFVNAAPITREGVLAPDGSIVRVGDSLFLVAAGVERYRTPPRRFDGAGLGLPGVMVGGPLLADIWDEAARVSKLREHVLILGESGSGKECVARVLHAARPTPGPFVGVNVTAIPESLFESEMYGHERGAFTGATVARPGAFREANDGVLFLDEVGDLPVENQVKLLRALDLQRVRPLGAPRDIQVNVRIVSATSHELAEECGTSGFRADLYYRLSGITIRVPPLRERRGDVLLLVRELLEGHSIDLSAGAAETLALGAWPGNARQLRQAVSRAVSRAGTRREIRREDVPDVMRAEEDSGLTPDRLRDALRRNGGVASHAARALGVSRTTFYKAVRRSGADTKTLLTGG
jgi:DNA-binding NtrC family response regulator